MNDAKPSSDAMTLIRQADLAAAIRHHAAGRFDEAESLYQRLFVSDPRDSEVIYLLGLLCCDLGLFEAARKFLTEALSIAPSFPEASRQMAVALNGLADQSASAGQLAEAQGFLEQAQKILPGDAQALQGLGRLALLRGEFAAAETHFVASLVRLTDDADTLTLLGLVRLKLGNHAAAEISLREALKLQPDLVQAHNSLGLALQHQQRLVEAQACFEQALGCDPAYQSARINLGAVLQQLGETELAFPAL